MKKGDRVVLMIDGRQIEAVIELASPNGDSIAVLFEAIVDGCVGMMPLLRESRPGFAGRDVYRNIVTGRLISVRPLEMQ